MRTSHTYSGCGSTNHTLHTTHFSRRKAAQALLLFRKYIVTHFKLASCYQYRPIQYISEQLLGLAHQCQVPVSIGHFFRFLRRPNVSKKRVERVLNFFYSRPNFDPPTLTHRRVCPTSSSSRGGTHSLTGERGGVPRQTLLYSVYTVPGTVCTGTLCFKVNDIVLS
jgi:hypothetical protein